MAAQQPITVFDGASPPVSHVFAVIDNKTLKDGTRFSMWREQLNLPSEAQVRLELYQRKLPSRTLETRAVVVVPVMESVSGPNAQGYTAAPKVAFEDRVEIKVFSHPRSTPVSRRLVKQIALNLFGNVSVAATPVSTGVLDEAFVGQVMPS